jgi:putative transposase
MRRDSTRVAGSPLGPVGQAYEEMTASFERFCLAAGLQTLGAMMEADATAVCGVRHGRGADRGARRWGSTVGPIGFHGGKIAVPRPRVRTRHGKEVALPSWEAAVAEDWLGRWAVRGMPRTLMMVGVTTRRFGRAVRLPEGDVPAGPGAGVSKSAASRRFVALSAERMAAWLGQDLSALDLLAVQIDGIHLAEDPLLVAAVGIDGEGAKHPPGLVEGATGNGAVVQALLDDLARRGLDPAVPRLFIVDGSKALSEASFASAAVPPTRRTFGADTPIQRCQVHKARSIVERLPKRLHAPVRRALRQAWELDDAAKAERLLRNLARTLGRQAPGVAGAILEGLDEILTVVRLGLPKELRRSLACTVGGIASNRRERHGLGPARLPQREALARRLHGAALDRRGHARGRQGLPQAEGQKSAAGLACGTPRPPPEDRRRQRGCSGDPRRITSIQATPMPLFNIGRDIPRFPTALCYRSGRSVISGREANHACRRNRITCESRTRALGMNRGNPTDPLTVSGVSTSPPLAALPARPDHRPSGTHPGYACRAASQRCTLTASPTTKRIRSSPMTSGPE